MLQVCSSDLFLKDLCKARWIFRGCKSNDRSRRHRKLQISAPGQMNATISNCFSFLWNLLLEGLDHFIQQSEIWCCLNCLVLPLEPPPRLLMLSFLCLERRKCFWLVHFWTKGVIAAVGSRSRWVSTYRHARPLRQHVGYNNMSLGGKEGKSRGPTPAALLPLEHTCLLDLLQNCPAFSLKHPLCG